MRRLAATAVAVPCLVVGVWGAGQQDPDSSAPDRVFSHDTLGFVQTFDLVCEAALAAAYEIGAREVQTTLDPVTGTPFVCIDQPPGGRSDWIEARFESAELVIDVAAADGYRQGATELGQPGAVAVWVWSRTIGRGDAHAEDLAGRYLAELDRAVADRLRHHPHGTGPTPTPWIGPPLEPTPLGPPELAPRTPIPGP